MYGPSAFQCPPALSGPIVKWTVTMWQVDIALDAPQPTVLHWAVNDWNLAAQQHWPAGTVQVLLLSSTVLLSRPLTEPHRPLGSTEQ